MYGTGGRRKSISRQFILKQMWTATSPMRREVYKIFDDVPQNFKNSIVKKSIKTYKTLNIRFIVSSET